MAEEEETPPRRARRSSRRILAVGVLVLVAVVAAALLWPQEEWERTGPPIAASSWAPWWQTGDAYQSFTANADLFGDVSVVAYRATDTTSILPYDGLASDAIPRFREAATATGVALIATIFDEAEPRRMAAILADPATRALHVDTIVGVVRDGGFDGVDLDYEQFAYSDGRDTWATTRLNWIAFLTELGAALHADGKLLIVSTPPVYDGEQTAASGYWVYDYASMGQVVDRIRVMAYDYSTSEPGPIAPIDWIERLVAAITDLVPPEKVVLGIPAYGRDWPVSTTGVCPDGQEPGRQSVSMPSAVELAAANGVIPTFDETTAEASFGYVQTLSGVDSAGNATSCAVTRRVHFMDAAGVHRRSWLAHRNDLQGVALWALGDESAEAWDAIRTARAGEDTWPSAGTTITTNTPSP